MWLCVGRGFARDLSGLFSAQGPVCRIQIKIGKIRISFQNNPPRTPSFPKDSWNLVFQFLLFYATNQRGVVNFHRKIFSISPSAGQLAGNVFLVSCYFFKWLSTLHLTSWNHSKSTDIIVKTWQFLLNFSNIYLWKFYNIKRIVFNFNKLRISWLLAS